MINYRIFSGIIIIAIAFSISFLACDKVKTPYIENTQSVVSNRKIIVEDFTGHKCGNCPDAHRLINQLMQHYGDKIIPIAIHCGYFSKINIIGTKYLTDFRTETGNYYGGDGEGTDQGYYNIQSYPVGLVNSVSPNDLAPFSSWSTSIENAINVRSKLEIGITNTCDTTTKTISSSIKTSALEFINKDLYLIVFLAEDSIYSWQTDYSVTPSDVDQYLHRHVLRRGLSSPLGEQIKSGSFFKDNFVETPFSTSYADKDWNVKKLYIIAFVYDFETKEILQAEEKSVL